MSQELTLLREGNTQILVSELPQSYELNSVSHDRCVSAGKALLDAITQQGGMTDELDKQVAEYIERSRKTIRKMNDRRTPVTKFFDDIRKVFTSLENEIDPAKPGSVSYELQQLRNAYAAKKRAEEEERRRAEFERQQREQARAKLIVDIENDLCRQFLTYLKADGNTMQTMYNDISLENIDKITEAISNSTCELPAYFIENLHCNVAIPSGFSANDIRREEISIKERLENQFAASYKERILELRSFYLDRIPSKRTHLELIAKSQKEEADRLKAEMEERQRQEALAREEERRRREEEERAMAEMRNAQAEAEGLFSAQAVVQEYQPDVKVTKKIELLNSKGLLPIFSMWWKQEGGNLSVEELSKIFKKQITFCEKLANKDNVFIEDENVVYTDEVKAK